MSKVKQLMKCPVCGNEQIEGAGFACPKCSFQFAYVVYFAGEKSRLLWQQKVMANKQSYTQLQTQKASDKTSDVIILGRDSVGFISGKSGELRIIYGDGRKMATYKDAVKYIANDNNSAILFADGTVRILGDNTYGQMDVSSKEAFSDITLAGPCTYLVKKDGRVDWVGGTDDSIKNAIKDWKGITSISGSERLVVGITGKGEPLVACTSDLSPEVVEEIARWKRVKKSTVYRDRCVALTDEGIVKTSWKDEYTSEVDKWKGIVDISYDGTYVIGLTSTGKVQLAGKVRSKLLDAGRSDAASWNDIVAISCSNFAIGGCDKAGNLHIAGKMGGKNDELVSEWSEKIREQISE